MELPELVVPDAAAWRRWLAKHHADPQGVWLVLAKKGVREPTSLTYAQALDEALCFGWIDGQIGRRDDATFRQRFTPRRPKSVWSKNNVANVERLTDAGRMRRPGLAAVDAAKADGRWDAAYAGAGAIEVPADLAGALAANKAAKLAFEGLNAHNRYAVLYRVTSAARPATRASRIEKYVEMLARGETIYPS